MDYRKLKGTEVIAIGRAGEVQMFVAEIDINEGITLKWLDEDAYKDGKYRACDLCLNRSTFHDIGLNGSYDEHFEYWIEAIKGGAIDLEKLYARFGEDYYNGTQGNVTQCAHG